MSLGRKRHVFILTAAGKPIFSNFPDDNNDLINKFSFLKAVTSIISLQGGDEIQSVRAGNSRVVFLFRRQLLFVIVSDSSEPEAILMRQLDYFYQYVLFILTAKVHELLEGNPSLDLSHLLGSDADRLFQAAGCAAAVSSPALMFHAVEQWFLDRPLRDEIQASLQDCVDKCGAAVGLLLKNDLVVDVQVNRGMGLVLNVSDTQLLVDFVVHSPALKRSEQHWIPVCLPSFNANGYLQAYVCALQVDLGGAVEEFTLVLVAQPQDLQNLIKGRSYLQRLLAQNAQTPPLQPQSTQTPHVPKLGQMAQFHAQTSQKLRDESSCLHLLFRYTPALLKSTSSSLKGAQSDADASLVYFTQIPQHLGRALSQPVMDRLWVIYADLGLRLRRGTAQLEGLAQMPSSSQNLRRAGNLSPSSPDSTAAQSAGSELDCIMREATVSDHALAVSLTSEMTVLALASFGCELYVAFPVSMPLQDASRMTIRLSLELKALVS